MEEWDTLESEERRGPYNLLVIFGNSSWRTRESRWQKYIMQDLGLGDQPYHQNILEAVNCMIKEWTNFVPPMTLQSRLRSKMSWLGLESQRSRK